MIWNESKLIKESWSKLLEIIQPECKMNVSDLIMKYHWMGKHSVLCQAH